MVAAMVRALIVIALLASSATADPINAVLGDASWRAGDPERAGEDARITAHLAHVLAELRARPSANPRREVLLDALAEYIAAGEFPRRTEDPYPGRRPRFIDDRGVHCAVGYLLARSGHGELAAAIDAEQEYAYVSEIHSPALAAWAREHGFTRDELAMIQPKYRGVPTEELTRDQIEREKDRITLACAEHGPLGEVKLRVVGDKRGKAQAAASSAHPFARCFAMHASTVEKGGGAYLGSPKTYDFTMKLKLASLQQLLDRRVAEIHPDDICSGRPGAIPRKATIAVSSAQPSGVAIRVTTSPANADVAGCFERWYQQRFQDFAKVTTKLAAQRTVAVLGRFEPRRVEHFLRSTGGREARLCYPAVDPPVKVTLEARAKVDDEKLVLRAHTPDATFAACIVGKLEQEVTRAFASHLEGKSHFRIDRDVATSVTVDVQSPAEYQKQVDELNRRSQRPY